MPETNFFSFCLFGYAVLPRLVEKNDGIKTSDEKLSREVGEQSGKGRGCGGRGRETDRRRERQGVGWNLEKGEGRWRELRETDGQREIVKS